MRKLIFILLASCVFVTHAQALDYKVETLTSDLNQPWSIAFLPNGDYLIALKVGKLIRVSADGTVGEALAGAPNTYYFKQGGYFDVVLDPNFEQNNTLYLSFAHGNSSAHSTRVIKAQLGAEGLTDVTPIFTGKVTFDTGKHYGGRLAFLPDDTLILSTGDGGDYRNAAQDKNSHLGKILRFTKDGEVPADNPFSNQSGGDGYVWSYGHRNPQGLAVDYATGVVYQHEHGPKGGDEVNVISAGSNYGWPAASYGVNYSGTRVSPYKTLPGMVDGIKVWVPGISPSGLAIYRGDLFPEWNGNLFVGGLMGLNVRRLVMQEEAVSEEHSMFPEIKARIRDVRVGPTGAIYILTDGPSGTLYKITR